MEQIISFKKKQPNLPPKIVDYHDVIIVSTDNMITSSGPLYIGSMLLKLNYNPKIIQHIDHFTWDEMVKIFDKWIIDEKQILALSLTFCREPWQKKKMKDLIYYVKSKFPELKIVAGGANNMFDFTGLPKDIVKLLGQNREDEIMQFFAQEKNVEWNELFDFTTFKIEYAKLLGNDHPKGMSMYLELSRGCIFNCAFCNYALRKSKSSHKKSEQIRLELEEFYTLFGTSEVIITCNTFNDDEDKIHEIAEAVKGLSFSPSFFAYTRLDLFAKQIDKPEIREFFSKYVKYPFFGIEGVTSKSLSIVGKQANVEKTKKTLLTIKEIMPDALITTSFIIGLPGQTFEDELEYFKWLEESDVSHFTSIIPLVINDKNDNNGLNEFSVFDENPEKYGIENIRDQKVVDEIFESKKEQIEELHLLEESIRGKYHPWKYTNKDYTFLDAFINSARIDRTVKIRRTLQRSRFMFLSSRGFNLPKVKEVSYFNRGIFKRCDDVKVNTQETLYLVPEQHKFLAEYIEYLLK